EFRLDAPDPGFQMLAAPVGRVRRQVRARRDRTFERRKGGPVNLLAKGRIESIAALQRVPYRRFNRVQAVFPCRVWLSWSVSLTAPLMPINVESRPLPPTVPRIPGLN